jgi:hypothetical protein
LYLETLQKEKKKNIYRRRPDKKNIIMVQWNLHKVSGSL